MSTLKLNIQEDGDVTLPGEVANSSLTLAEIGALVCFAALQTGEVELSPSRFGGDEMKQAVESLKTKGVIKASVEGRRVSIVIDLASVMPIPTEASERTTRAGGEE